MTQVTISGAKGRPKTPPPPRPAQEAPNTLQSKNTIRIIDVIGEGKIVGLVNGLQSVFLDDTPVENADGTANFEGVTIEEKLGDPDPNPLKGFPFTETEISVGVEVTQSTPVTRTISDPDVDAVRVKMRLPRLTEQNLTTGDLNGSEVEFKIEVQPNGGGFELAENNFSLVEFSGSTTSANAQGLKVTASKTVNGIFGSTVTDTITIEYREVGSGTWLTLGTRDVSVVLTEGLPGQNTTGTISATFEVSNLAKSDYEIQATSGTIVKSFEKQQTNIKITGKTTSPYEIAYRVELPEGGAPWNVRVTRITADSEVATLQNQTFWSQYTEIIDAKLSHPDTALIGITIDAESFGNNIPRRSYEVKGLEVFIPSNYDPATRVYTGIWDGTFQIGWTDNPAWILYDLLTNSRYGLGNFITPAQVDKFGLYAIAQYCDTLVDDGFGGQEPRFTFNGVINTRREAYEVVNAITSNFRAMAYWGTGSINVVQDSPADPVKLIAPANVIDGDINYPSSALKTRHTAVLVTWNDPGDNFNSTIAVVEDRDLIEKFGWKQADTAAIGCTSRGQATRFGKWFLDTEKNEGNMIEYKAGLDHADLRPGDVISVADPAYANVRFGGRMISVNGGLDEVTIDKAITIESGETYTLSIVLPDGTVEDVTINNSAGEVTTLTLDYALSQTPVNGAMWVITASNVSPRKFRVIGIKETKKHEYDIVGLFHDPNKYARIEQNIVVEPPSYTTFPSGSIVPPSGLSASEYLFQAGVAVKSAITISWTGSTDARVVSYEVRYKGPNDPDFRFLSKTAGTSIDLQDTTQGEYTFEIRAVSGVDSVKSVAVTLTGEFLGLAARPSDVTGFSIQNMQDSAYLSWDAVTDLDLDHYEIRFFNALSGATWGSANTLIKKVSKDATGVSTQTLIGTYLIKAVDTSGNESENASLIVSNIGQLIGLNAVETISEHPSFLGVHENTQETGNQLQLVDTTLDGTYTFFNQVDLGEKYASVRITTQLDAFGTDLFNNVDLWTNVDEIDNWDGGDPGTWRVQIEERHTDDHPDLTDAVWSDYNPVVMSDYSARAFQFRAKLFSLLAGISPSVEELSVTVDMPDRTTGNNDVVCTVGGITVSYSPPFRVAPALAISAQGLATGDYYSLTNKTRSGFDIEFFDSGNNSIQRTFDWASVGYGHDLT